MAQQTEPDESISILDDFAIYRDSASVPPEFHIYSGRSLEVEEASHYALNLSCQSLQKRNRELEQQVHYLKSRNKSLTVDSKVEMNEGTSADAMTSSENGASASEEFIQYLQKELGKEQLIKSDLASQLDDERTVFHKLKKRNTLVNQELDESLGLLSRRGLELDTIRTENDQLKSTVAQLREELDKRPTSSGQDSRDLQGHVTRLNAELSSMQQLYEEAATKNEDFEDKLNKVRREKSELEQTIEEKDKTIERLRTSKVHLEEKINSEIASFSLNQTNKYSNGQAVTTAAGTDDYLLKCTRVEIAALQSQIIEMQGVIQEQTSLIRLLVSKLRNRSRGSLVSSASSDSRSMTPINGNTPPRAGARPRTVNTMTEGQTSRQSCDVPESRPIYCEEDLESLEHINDEPRTLVMADTWVKGQDQQVNNAGEMDARRFSAIARPQPLSNPPIFNNRTTHDQNTRGAISSADIHQVRPSSPPIHQVANSPAIPQVAWNQQTAMPRYSFRTEAVVPKRRHTEPLTNHLYHAPPSEPIQTSFTEPLTTGDNRFSSARNATPINRQINIERNVDPNHPSPHNNRTQNVNLVEMASDKNADLKPRGDLGGQRVILNNHPLNGNKPIPQQNIYTETTNGARAAPGQHHSVYGTREPPTRTCPICSQEFPAEISQTSFEVHVEACLDHSSSDPESPQPSPVNSTVKVMECPVCHSVYSPCTSQEMFEEHVESHFSAPGYDVLETE